MQGGCSPEAEVPMTAVPLAGRNLGGLWRPQFRQVITVFIA